MWPFRRQQRETFVAGRFECGCEQLSYRKNLTGEWRTVPIERLHDFQLCDAHRLDRDVEREALERIEAKKKLEARAEFEQRVLAKMAELESKASETDK